MTSAKLCSINPWASAHLSQFVVKSYVHWSRPYISIYCAGSLTRVFRVRLVNEYKAMWLKLNNVGFSSAESKERIFVISFLLQNFRITLYRVFTFVLVLRVNHRCCYFCWLAPQLFKFRAVSDLTMDKLPHWALVVNSLVESHDDNHAMQGEWTAVAQMNHSFNFGGLMHWATTTPLSDRSSSLVCAWAVARANRCCLAIGTALFAIWVVQLES